MAKQKITKPPGIEDIFPESISKWNFINDTARDIFRNYNYKEIILPIFEFTEVFSRGLGTETDIVSKEMFSFEDRGGRNLTLRPEGTASVVRAYIENGDYNRLSTCKFFYIGPMFRAEKPQKGRQRQFNQFGAEFFGSKNPFFDHEIISLTDSIIKKLGIRDYSLLLNTIGCPECRVKFIEELKEYYKGHVDELCKNCKRRLETNTLRLLDCKDEYCIKLNKNAPKISAYICSECSDHFVELKKHLDHNDIDYTEDSLLVRGLDYYTRTTFEFISDNLGGQNAFAAGGRYDNLVETFGGKPVPAIGFAAGIERIMLLIEGKDIPEKSNLNVYIVHTGNNTVEKAVELSSALRAGSISVDMDPEPKGFKSQFKKADRENAELAVIIGEDEIKNNEFTVKNMKSGEQENIKQDNILEYIKTVLNL